MAFNPPTSDFGFESKEQKKFHQTVYYGEQVSQVTQKLMRESETTTPTPAPTPSNLPPGERPIAPLRRRLPATQGRAATMEERVTQSEALNKELQNRIEELKFDLKEEQITKQQQINQQQQHINEQRGIIETLREEAEKQINQQQATNETLREEAEKQINQQQRQINEQQGIIEALRKNAEEHINQQQRQINQQQTIIDAWREKAGEIDHFRKQYENLATYFQTKKMEDKQKAEEIEKLRRDLDEEKVKSEAFQTNYNEQTNKLEEIRADYDAQKTQLQEQLEAIRQDYDAQQIQLQEAEQRVSEMAETIRLNTIQIEKSDASFKALESEITGSKKTFKDLEARLRDRTSQIKAKDGELKLKDIEIDDLTRRNKALMQNNKNFEFEKEKTKQQIKDLKVEIDQLQTQRDSRDHIESVLAEVTANAAELRESVTFLERENSDLRATIEDLNSKDIGTESAYDFLQSELDEVNNGNQSDGELAPISTKDCNELEDLKLSEKDAEERGELEQKGKDSSTMTEQTGGDISTMTGQMSKDSTTMTEQMGKNSSTMTEQMVKDSSTMTEQMGRDSSTMTEWMSKNSSTITELMGNDSSTMTEIRYLNAAPVIHLKRHNPIACWFQVYLDLWVLFMALLAQSFIKSFRKRILGSSSRAFIENDHAISNRTPSSSTALEGAASTTTPQAGPGKRVSAGLAIEDVAPVVAIDASTSAGPVNPKAEPLLWQPTLFTFCLHLLFYYALFVCLSIYYERSIWLTANELTRKYLHDIYNVPYPQNRGTFHRLLGNVQWLGVLRYNIHHWSKISRALPG